MMWRPRLRRLALLLALLGSGLATIGVADQVRKHMGHRKPKADLVDLPYGPHERNVLDLWKVPGGEPRRSPVVVFFHGGGFIGGDKRSVPGWLVARCLQKGISVVSA